MSKNRTCCPSQRGWPAPSATLPGFAASHHSFKTSQCCPRHCLFDHVHFPWKMRAPIFFMFLFLFLLCEATNFFFLRTRMKGATTAMALKPNTVIARAYTHKQPCSNCSNETTERDNCSADVRLESRKSASQAHLHLSTTVSTCPLYISKFEIEPPRLTIQFLRFRLSQLSDLLPLVQHYLLRPHEEEAHSDCNESSILNAGQRAQKLNTRPLPHTTLTTKQRTPEPPDTHSTTSTRVSSVTINSGAKHSTENASYTWAINTTI